MDDTFDVQVALNELMSEVSDDGELSSEDKGSLLERLGMDVHTLSATVGVPVSTIETWTRGGRPGPLFEGQLRRATTIARRVKEQRETYG